MYNDVQIYLCFNYGITENGLTSLPLPISPGGGILPGGPRLIPGGIIPGGGIPGGIIPLPGGPISGGRIPGGGPLMGIPGGGPGNQREKFRKT